LLFLLVLPLAIGNLHNGQANPLVLGLVLATAAAAAEQRWNLAGACTALACLLKVYPIAVGLLLMVLYPRQLGRRLAAALAVGLLLPFVLQEPGYVAAQYRAWFACLGADDRSGFPLEVCYRDLQQLSRVCRVPLGLTAFRVLQLVAGAGMAALCLAGRHAGWPRRRLLVFAVGLGCCWMTLFGPATESCTYLLLAPTLAWGLLAPATPTWGRVWLAGSYGLLVVAAAACWFPGGRAIQALGLQPLAGLLLLTFMVAESVSGGLAAVRRTARFCEPPLNAFSGPGLTKTDPAIICQAPRKIHQPR
jgi:hypothetical protein